MAGEEEHPVVVVEVAVGARHVLALEVDAAVLDAGLQRVAAGHERPAVRRAPDPLDVPEVPGVADAAGVALRADVDRRHQRGEAADRVLERVVDAERRVEDVAVLRDARVLQVVVADVALRAAAANRSVCVFETPPSHAGVWPSVGDGDASAQPNASSTSCIERVSVARVWLDMPMRCWTDPKPGEAVQLGRDHLLLQILAAERAVAAEHRLAAGRRRDQQLAVALRVQDVQRHRDGCRPASARGTTSRAGSAKNLRDEAGLLLGGERAQRVHEVLREPRVVLRAGPDPLVGDARQSSSALRMSVSPVGRPVAALALVA